ncbi:MAG: hypothetical protein FWC41_07110 [Firmicutes bacterium]|nr:hypothetical protein [Bacillota bacterium]
METLTVEVINPQAKQLLLDLEALNLITVQTKEYKLRKLIEEFRKIPDSDMPMEKITPQSMKGALKEYANPDLIPLEKEAWAMHCEEKYGNS